MARVVETVTIEQITYSCDLCGVHNDGYWTCCFCGRELCEDCQEVGWVRPAGDHRTHCLRCAEIGKPFLEQRRAIDMARNEALQKLSDAWRAAALAAIEAERNQKQEKQEP